MNASYVLPIAVVVDGDWGAWLEWSVCSETCGNGTKSRTRNCDNPSAQYGGQSCQGSANDTAQCFERHCPGMFI